MEWGIDVEDAVRELATEIEQGVNFLFSEFGAEWERAERYYAGRTDLEDVTGRSQVVKTEVRDAIRGLKPDVMRALLHGRKPVEYVPNALGGALLAEQQSLFVRQLFTKCGGYRIMYNMVEESMKKKICPVKTYWISDPVPEYSKVTGVTAQEVELLESAEDVDVLEIVKTSNPLPRGFEGTFYDVEFVRYRMNGQICIETFPSVEFFINRNATGIADSTVHGHRRNVTVGEALAMGLDYDDWLSLDPDDPEMNEHSGESVERRGYQKHEDGDLDTDDPIGHFFLLTECYCEYDLEGSGYPQKYVFYLGGSSYTYLHHERIDDWAIDLCEIDPVPFAALGRSIADLTMEEQDLNTSILRAVADNFHMSNNPRPIANPLLVDFADLMNNAIGAPIKSKGGGVVDTFQIPFTGGQGIPFLQYLEADVQNKTGVTKASQGLDPDAMQSTDKEAVRNTIMRGAGQAELIVRNIIETALIPIFRKLLRLSIRHLDRYQVVLMKGEVVPVDQFLLDPDLLAEPNVGLGTASHEQKLMGLNFILAQQEKVLMNFGLDNPMVSLSNIYNTLEDIVEMSGFYNVGRYFKMVTPKIEQLLAQQRTEAAALAKQEGKDNMPIDPSQALLMAERTKSQVRELEIMAKREKDARDAQQTLVKLQADEDFRRDKLIQDRQLKLIEIQEEGRAKRADARIRREQTMNNAKNAKATLKNARTNAGQGPAREPETSGEISS